MVHGGEREDEDEDDDDDDDDEELVMMIVLFFYKIRYLVTSFLLCFYSNIDVSIFLLYLKFKCASIPT